MKIQRYDLGPHFYKSWITFVRCVVIIAITTAARISVYGQTSTFTPTEGLGISPSSPYNPSDIDNINLSNGNVFFHVPLVTYPQRGKVHLSFSLSGNSNQWITDPPPIPQPSGVIKPGKWSTTSEVGIQILADDI